jgi:hypothetical protein
VNEEKKAIAKEYLEFIDSAIEAVKKEMLEFQWDGFEKFDRYTEHVIGMLQMYASRYGDADQRQSIVNYIEEQFIPRIGRGGDSVKIWDNVKKKILSGDYDDLMEMKNK